MANDICQLEKPAPDPRADLGILLVHGIGDHQEGQTLTAFGEPLLDWMRRWIRQRQRGAGKERQQGELILHEARLKADAAPAYALAELKVPQPETKDASGSAPLMSERWLVCEGWWGGSVQPPRSLDLLRWMWSRGPLMIYWHFYLASLAFAERWPQSKDGPTIFSGILAFFIASFCQIVVSIALLLWLIPIGPWRNAVVAAVRTLTLTLGDSYVLLEQEIQHAALVERVRRSLDWLAERTGKIIVIAHSQGGAIAHEALQRFNCKPPTKVTNFISVGSGLEKLHFLRFMLGRRAGLVLSSLVLPMLLLTVALFVVTWNGPGWQKGLAYVGAFVTVGTAAGLLGVLQSYHKEILGKREALRPGKNLEGMTWLDLFATDDAVPMGRGSILRGADFLTQKMICNGRSLLRDHVSYFSNYNDCLHRIWLAIAPSSQAPLFGKEDSDRLERFARLHNPYAWLAAFSGVTSVIAALIIGFLRRKQLFGFGESVVNGIHGTPVEDWLKPVQTVAAAGAWLVNRWWPGSATTPLLTQAFFGLLLLLGGVWLWEVGFRAFWQSRCTARWRAVARGRDLPETLVWNSVRRANLLLFSLASLLPLVFAGLLFFCPEALTFGVLGRLLAGLFSLLTLVGALFYAVAGPWLDRSLQQSNSRPTERLRLAWSAAFGVILLLAGARALWPATLVPGAERWIIGSVGVVMAAAWQGYALIWHRRDLGLIMSGLVLFLPVLGTIAFWYGPRSLYIYMGITAILIAVPFVWRHYREILQEFPDGIGKYIPKLGQGPR